MSVKRPTHKHTRPSARPAHHGATARTPQRATWTHALARIAASVTTYLRHVWRTSRRPRQTWAGPIGTALGLCLAFVLVTHIFADAASAAPSAAPWPGTTNAPEVSVAVDLHNPALHPRQLAYDAARDGLWFWTSTQDRGVRFDNHVYFYDLHSRQVRSWPLYAGDWSSQLLSGLAVAPDGSVWIGWNLNLVVFHPADGSYVRYALPAQPRYPLPSAVLGDLPANLGVADLAVGRDGTVWIARYGALSLTTFAPGSQTFTEHPLPTTAGDPAKLALEPDGRVTFTINLSADHPGYGFERVGEYDPRNGTTRVYAQPASALALSAQGDLYTTIDGTIDGHPASLMRLRAAARAQAETAGRVPTFERGVVPFATDGGALAVDARGRVWMAVAGQPDLAVLDPASGHYRLFQYAALSVAAHPAHAPRLGPAAAPLPTAAPHAVWTSHMAAMTTDSAGHLWYIRGGNDQIEEVQA